MKVGILGGTFDPIHIGHLLMAEMTQEELSLDRVLFVPASDPPHKQQQPKTAIHHRQIMTELAIVGNPCFELCTVDIDRPGPHYSTDTVKIVQAQYNLSAEETFFIIGGDSLKDLPSWHNPDELIKSCYLAVIRRPGYEINVTELEKIIPGLSRRIKWVQMPALDISSSEIQARVVAGQSIRYKLLDAVREYIYKHNLYYVTGEEQ